MVRYQEPDGKSHGVIHLKIRRDLNMLVPKISVIMPVYNSEAYIRYAIESILNQTFSDFEFIIIDGASKDKSYEITQKYAQNDGRIVSLKTDENIGLIETLNMAIRIARGKYIARMDADDISLLDRLSKQFEYMEKNPEIGISGGTMQIVDMNGRVIGQRSYHLKDEEIRKNIFRHSPFSHPLIIIRKSVLDKAGFYDPEYNDAEDYELYFRIGKYAKFGNLVDILLKYRVHKNSVTISKIKKMEARTLEIRKKYSNGNGYSMTLFDEACNLVIHGSKYFVPYKIKIWIFNFIRNDK